MRCYIYMHNIYTNILKNCVVNNVNRSIHATKGLRSVLPLKQEGFCLASKVLGMNTRRSKIDLWIYGARQRRGEGEIHKEFVAMILINNDNNNTDIIALLCFFLSDRKVSRRSILIFC